jgi:transcriptional regulator with XRE-family HTH domain
MLPLYKNIEKLRKENKWTQEELSSRMGYTDRSMIAKIESGKVDLSQSKILEFANVFGVMPGDLMGEVEEIKTYTPGRGEALTSYIVKAPDYDFNNDKVEKAMRIMEKIDSLTPEKQAALLNYLAFLQSES